MELSGLLGNFFLKFWLWFTENIWPAVKKYFSDFILKVLDKIYAELRLIVANAMEEKACKASSNAKSAEEQAATANNEDEVAKFKAEAEIWKKVALEYSANQSELEEKFNQHQRLKVTEVVDKISKITLKADLQSSNPNIKIGDQETSIPI